LFIAKKKPLTKINDTLVNKAVVKTVMGAAKCPKMIKISITCGAICPIMGTQHPMYGTTTLHLAEHQQNILSGANFAYI
jgi:hypothetical protein